MLRDSTRLLDFRAGCNQQDTQYDRLPYAACPVRHQPQAFYRSGGAGSERRRKVRMLYFLVLFSLSLPV
jgi:hypothetical protein